MNNQGHDFTKSKDELEFTYRGWSMEPQTLVLSAILALKQKKSDEIKATCRSYQEQRMARQPLTEPSAGSFFKNPPENSAGRLIDQAGLKGYSVGGAKISEKHANFIINTGNASAADILNLMQHVQEVISKRFGINLEPEIHILGDAG
jgi:UDP-N-acetylmuramate dehydrogenase